MKRKSIILALFLFLVIAFVGCNNANEKVTIEFWHNYSASDGQITVLETLIAEFEEDNPNIEVNHVFMEWSALKNSVTLGASTGVLPDVLRGDIAFVPQFQSLNVLLAISEFDDYETQAAKVLASANSSNIMGDDYYGLAANTNTKILFYNEDLLEAADVDVPESLDELWAALPVLKSDSVIGMVEPWTGIWNVGPYIWSEGGEVLSPDNTTAEGYINSQIVVDVIQTLADLYQAGELAGPSMDPGATGDTDGWASELYAFELDGPWRAASNTAAGINYGAIPLPEGSEGSISVLGGENFMQFKNSSTEEQVAAWKFIKFMTDEHAQVEMAKVGQMPVNLEALENAEAVTAMPLLPVFQEALLTARARPVIPQWSQVEDIIATKVAEAITGTKTVQVALDEAAAAIDELLGD
ncbi:MAG: extracellular solute-binding protein [Candidatus Izemoplasmatales bacterium]|nr:extracellular solute-binding protein [Candidatus Izemoplasmatales bacterium]